MLVRMKVSISGSRNGVKWPARGEVIEVTNEEGSAYCSAGLAEPVRDEAETATLEEQTEKAVDPTPRRGRPPGSKNKPKPESASES